MPESHVKFYSEDGKRRVLIVEDEPINQELLRYILQEDYNLAFASDGATAMSIIREQGDVLSLLLLDLNLPDMNGLEILRWVRADKALSRLPVIVLTSDKESEVASLSAGAMDFIPKPYPMPKVVLARVLRTIELSEDRDILRSTERDTLTGLYNQEFFYRYAEQYDIHHKDALMDAIVIDVNHFHMINERYGKAYGDEVLRRIGNHVRDIVKDSGGIVCRHEADTFYIYCPHRTDYGHIFERASADLVDESHRRTHMRLRMGVYSGVDKAIDIERRFDRANLAANSVRGNFNRGIAIYDSAMHETELFEERLLESFQDAIEEHQFKVYYQAKFDVRPSEPVLSSSEALVRWVHPELGMVSPGVFVPLFEKNGLIQQLDSYIWREVAAQLRDWKTRLGFAAPVSVNVSRVDMYDEDFVANMRGLVEEYGLTSDDLLLEITESAYTEDSDQIIDTVSQLRDAGFRIEMDDFGSGYSSLNMVSTLPIDALKLDMQFIRNAFKGRRDTRMLEVVLEIADSLMVPSIAEGVETAEQMFTLKSLGCDIVQGYYFSRPVPAEQFEGFLRARAKGSEDRTAGNGEDGNRFGYETLHDPQTGLYNAEAFDMLFRDGDRSSIALLMADLPDDGVNDARVQQVAEVLRHSFRAVDFLCRVGMGRFAVIMTRVRNNMRKQIEEKVARINEKLAGPEWDGLTFGVAFSERDTPGGNIVQDALSALEAAKADGGARCRIF